MAPESCNTHTHRLFVRTRNYLYDSMWYP